MKRVIILGMALVMMVIYLSGCWMPYDDRGGGGGHDRGDRQHDDRGDRHDRDDRH